MIVLDIAIGIVLIYFLYSLLSSIIAEIISSWIGMRARMLKQGIDNILNDKQIGSGQDTRKWLQDIFLVEDNNFRYTNAGKFYEEPSIKYLAKPGEQAWYSLRNRKPAYVSPETFVITVLNMFSNKGRGISEWDKVKFAIETNAMHLEPETLKMFQDLVKRSDDNFKNFVDLLLHHFADTMDRVNGWYKRKIGTIIFYIGLFLCTLLNVDTFQIINTLSNDKEKRLQMVKLAENVIDKKAEIDSFMSIEDSLEELNYKMKAHAMVKSAVIEANDILATGWEFKINVQEKRICISDDPICWRCITESQAKYVEDSIKLSKGKRGKINELKKKIKNNPLIVKDIKTILDSISILEDEIKQLTKSIQDTIGLSFIEYDTTYRKNHNFWIKGQAYPPINAKAKVIINAMLPWKSKFWGIVLTALALTLGAQFWFDLLKKLVSIRSSGVKPEESEEKKRQITQLKMEGEKVTSKDPVEIAISENRAYWESLPGILAINKSNKMGFIQIIAEEPESLKEIIRDEIYTNDSMYKVNIEILKGNKATFLSNQRGYVYLDNPDSRGSVAGVFYNKKTNKKCYLTCAHVVQRYEHGHFDYNNSVVKESDTETNIGNVTNLIRSSFIDAAVIDFDQHVLENKYGIGIITDMRDIEDITADQRANIAFKSNALDNPVSGRLEMTAFSCKFDNDRFMYNLMLIKHEREYSDGGDSGSLLYVHEKPNDINSKIISIGILIGSATYGNEKYTLGISLKEICNVLNIRHFNNQI